MTRHVRDNTDVVADVIEPTNREPDDLGSQSGSRAVRITRRRALWGSAGLLGGLALSSLGRARSAQAHVLDRPVPEDPTKILTGSEST